MACILQSECKFLHGFFRCCLPVEMVDVEVKITSMQGIYTFMRDRTCQIIKCNPWSTKLHPHLTLIKKMRTYLVLEGKLVPKSKIQSQLNKSRPTQPNANLLVRREAKATDKRRKLIPTKRYEVRIVAKPESTHKASNIITQMSTTAPSTTMSLKREFLPKEAHQAKTPHHLKIFKPVLALHGPEQGQCWETYLKYERTGQSLLHLLPTPQWR